MHLHDEARIPDDVVVSAGISPSVRSWTCPVVVLKRKDVLDHGDEDIFPPSDGGIAHPIPPPPPCWMGLDGPNLHEDDSVGNHVSHSAQGPSRGGDAHMSDDDSPAPVVSDDVAPAV